MLTDADGCAEELREAAAANDPAAALALARVYLDAHSSLYDEALAVRHD
jgi:hypothetical protein